MLIKKIGIDLGTANTLVYIPKKGIIINEPTVVAIKTNSQVVLAMGSEAREMLERTPEMIVAHRPLKDGAISDYRSTEAILRYFIQKAFGRFNFFRPEVMIAVSVGISSTERRAVLEAANKAGAKQTYLLKEPLASAFGAGVPISAAVGNLVVNIGGGTTEVAVISLGGIVAAESLRLGGVKLDQAIQKEIKKKYGLLIGERTAEQIKIAIGSALPLRTEKYCEVWGQDIVTGLPRVIKVTSEEITVAFQEPLSEILKTIKNVLRETPPELAADIVDQGIILSGGGGLLKNLDKMIYEYFGIDCLVAEEPLLDVIKGVGIVLESLEDFKQALALAR